MSLFFQRFLGFQPAAARAQAPISIPHASPETTPPFGNNPFLQAMNPGSPERLKNYAINRPLDRPMFLGYKGDKALYGGSRLFILS